MNCGAKKGGRLQLSRVTDVIDVMLNLLRDVEGTSTLTEWLVLDFTDRFFQPSERRHFAFFFKGQYAVYTVQPQGSVNAPFVCGRVHIARLTQGACGSGQLRLQAYVDHPCICLSSLVCQRDANVAALMLLWHALGVRLKFNGSAHVGSGLQAQGAVRTKAQIVATAKQYLIDELRSLTNRHLHTNVVTIKELSGL